MAQTKYAFQGFKDELMARALGRDLPVSAKQAIEICNYLRHRKLAQAKMLLEKVIAKKHAIPFKRFMNGLGHRRGKLASGRYPVKASQNFLSLLESVEANAQTKGLNTNSLEIIHICAHKAHSPVHYGRHHGREFKRTHVEIVVQETAGGEKKKTKKEPAKAEKAAPKPEVKKAEEKPQEKKEEKAEEKKEEPAKPAEEKKETPEPKPEQPQENKQEVSGEPAEKK